MRDSCPVNTLQVQLFRDLSKPNFGGILNSYIHVAQVYNYGLAMIWELLLMRRWV